MATEKNINRPVCTENFTALPNALFDFNRHYEQANLKPRDSSVLNYLLSKPPYWKLRAKDIATGVNICERTAYKALMKLQKIGFARYTRETSGHTHWYVSVVDSGAVNNTESAIAANSKKSDGIIPQGKIDNEIKKSNFPLKNKQSLKKILKTTTNSEIFEEKISEFEVEKPITTPIAEPSLKTAEKSIIPEIAKPIIKPIIEVKIAEKSVIENETIAPSPKVEIASQSIDKTETGISPKRVEPSAEEILRIKHEIEFPKDDKPESRFEPVSANNIANNLFAEIKQKSDVKTKAAEEERKKTEAEQKKEAAEAISKRINAMLDAIQADVERKAAQVHKARIQEITGTDEIPDESETETKPEDTQSLNELVAEMKLKPIGTLLAEMQGKKPEPKNQVETETEIKNITEKTVEEKITVEKENESSKIASNFAVEDEIRTKAMQITDMKIKEAEAMKLAMEEFDIRVTVNPISFTKFNLRDKTPQAIEINRLSDELIPERLLEIAANKRAELIDSLSPEMQVIAEEMSNKKVEAVIYEVKTQHRKALILDVDPSIYFEYDVREYTKMDAQTNVVSNMLAEEKLAEFYKTNPKESGSIYLPPEMKMKASKIASLKIEKAQEIEAEALENGFIIIVDPTSIREFDLVEKTLVEVQANAVANHVVGETLVLMAQLKERQLARKVAEELAQAAASENQELENQSEETIENSEIVTETEIETKMFFENENEFDDVDENLIEENNLIAKETLENTEIISSESEKTESEEIKLVMEMKKKIDEMTRAMEVNLAEKEIEIEKLNEAAREQSKFKLSFEMKMQAGKIANQKIETAQKLEEEAAARGEMITIDPVSLTEFDLEETSEMAIRTNLAANELVGETLELMAQLKKRQLERLENPTSPPSPVNTNNEKTDSIAETEIETAERENEYIEEDIVLSEEPEQEKLESEIDAEEEQEQELETEKSVISEIDEEETENLKHQMTESESEKMAFVTEVKRKIDDMTQAMEADLAQKELEIEKLNEAAREQSKFKLSFEMKMQAGKIANQKIETAQKLEEEAAARGEMITIDPVSLTEFDLEETSEMAIQANLAANELVGETLELMAQLKKRQLEREAKAKEEDSHVETEHTEKTVEIKTPTVSVKPAAKNVEPENELYPISKVYVLPIPEDEEKLEDAEKEAQKIAAIAAAIDVNPNIIVEVDIPQLTMKEKIIAKKAIAKVSFPLQKIIISMLRAALQKGGIKSPLAYLNGLINKALAGELDIDHIEEAISKKAARESYNEKIKKIFALHSETIKMELKKNGYIMIQGIGSLYETDFERLGLIERRPGTRMPKEVYDALK